MASEWCHSGRLEEGADEVLRHFPSALAGADRYNVRPMSYNSLKSTLSQMGPGILLAATGVGAGDLATAAFTGNRLGTAVLWAVLVGAGFKFVLNEGLARWQLASGTTFLEGGVRHLGRPFLVLLLFYLIFWSFFVGTALISACGAAFHALVPVFDSPQSGKVVFGILHSILGAILVFQGGYKVFEKAMSFFIALMFVTVVTTAVLLVSDWSEIARGLFLPAIPDASGGGLGWTVALMGGVGGTLTILCYGYWIRTKGREGPQALRVCRWDLAVAYLLTAVFGLAMVIIGAAVRVNGSGAGLVVALGEKLQEPLGAPGRWIFLFGAWGAVASSLLGVWQCIPYLFADLWRLMRPHPSRRSVIDVRQPAYRAYLLFLTFVPMLGLFGGFRRMQWIYSVVGAAFMPLLAVLLLFLNGSMSGLVRRGRFSTSMPNSKVITGLLLLILFFFVWAGWRQVWAGWQQIQGLLTFAP